MTPHHWGWFQAMWFRLVLCLRCKKLKKNYLIAKKRRVSWTHCFDGVKAHEMLFKEGGGVFWARASSQSFSWSLKINMFTPHNHHWPLQTCGSVWWRSLRSDGQPLCQRCGSCPAGGTQQGTAFSAAHTSIRWNCSIHRIMLNSPCRCRSRPRRPTGTLHPGLRCRWSKPGSSSCVWRRAAGYGTPARSCPGIRPAWPLAWWCTASGSCRHTHYGLDEKYWHCTHTHTWGCFWRDRKRVWRRVHWS